MQSIQNTGKFPFKLQKYNFLIKFASFFVTIKAPVMLFCKNHSCYEDIPFRNQKQENAPCLLYMVRILSFYGVLSYATEWICSA